MLMCVMCRLKEYLIIFSQNLILEKKYTVKDKVTVFSPFFHALSPFERHTQQKLCMTTSILF